MNSQPPIRDNEVAISQTHRDKLSTFLGASTSLASVTQSHSENGIRGQFLSGPSAESQDYVDTVPFSAAANSEGKLKAKSNPLSRHSRDVTTTVHSLILRHNYLEASNPEKLSEAIAVATDDKNVAMASTDTQEHWNDLLIRSALRWQNHRARKFGFRLGVGRDGVRRFNWDDQTLEIAPKGGDDIVCPATVIGTHYIKSKLFVSGWMDRRLPLSARQSSSLLLAKVQAQDIELFDSVAKEYDEFKVWGLAAVATRVCGADMVCRGRVDQSWMYLSIVLPEKITRTKF